MGFHGRRAPEARKHFLYRGPGSHFPLALSADPIRQGKQPAVGTDQCGRRREYVPEIVLIPRANGAHIRKLRELDVKHRTAKFSSSTKISPQRTQRCTKGSLRIPPSCNFVSFRGSRTKNSYPLPVSQADGTRFSTSVVRPVALLARRK